MADNSVGGLNIRIGADISEGERQIQKFVREFDTALKELSMGRRGGLYTTSAFRTAVEREQSRAQEEFARGGVFGATGQDLDPQAYRGVLMRGSGYAQLAAQEEAARQRQQKENELWQLAFQADQQGRVALEEQYLKQIEALRETDAAKRLRLASEAAEKEIAIAIQKRDALVKAQQDEADAMDRIRAGQVTRMRNLPVDATTGEIDTRRAEIYLLRKAGETAEADARQQQLNDEKKAAEQQAEARRQIAQAEAIKIQKINEVLELSRKAYLDGNLALEEQYLKQIAALQETDAQKRIRLATDAAEREIAIANQKRDALTKAQQDEADALEQLRAAQITRMRNLPRDPVSGDIDPNRAAAYMLRRGGEAATATNIEEGVRMRRQSAEKQAQIDEQILMHRQARLEAARDKNAQLEAAHIRIIEGLQESSHTKEAERVRRRGEEEAAAELRRQREQYENKKRFNAMSPTERKVSGLRESGEFEAADRIEQKYLRLRRVLDEINAPTRERVALVERMAVLAELEAEAIKRGNTALVDRIKIEQQNTAERIKQIDSPGALDQVGKAANNAKYAVMNLAYGVQDAATVFGTSGFAGAIRASANNLTAIGPLMKEVQDGSTTLAKALSHPEVMLIGGATAALIAVDAYTAYQKKQEELRNARIKEMAEFRMEEMRARPGQAEQAVAFETQLRRAQESGVEAAYELARSQAEALEGKKAAVDVAEKQLAQESAILQELINQKQTREEMQGQVTFRVPQAGRGEAGIQAAMQSRDEQAGLAAIQERIEAQQQRIKQLQEDTDKAYKDRNRAESDALKAEENYNEARLKADEKTRRDLDIERMMFERKEQLRFSDIAIAQTERILGERQARVAQLRQQAQAGPQFASMVAAGTQEDVAARLRMRAGTAAIDPLLEEAKKQVIEQREIRDELRAIREKMQPGYMVETFRP